MTLIFRKSEFFSTFILTSKNGKATKNQFLFRTFIEKRVIISINLLARFSVQTVDNKFRPTLLIFSLLDVK